MNSNPGDDSGPDEEAEAQDEEAEAQVSSSQDEPAHLEAKPKKKKSSRSASKTSLPALEKGMAVIPPGKTVFFDLDYNFAAAACYFPLVPGVAGILWLVTENQQENEYLRFHSIQGLVLTCVSIAACVVVGTMDHIVAIIPVIGGPLSMIFLLVRILVGLATMAICVRTMIAVYKGKEGKIPIVSQITNRIMEPSR